MGIKVKTSGAISKATSNEFQEMAEKLFSQGMNAYAIARHIAHKYSCSVSVRHEKENVDLILHVSKAK